jgi:hypothetical protein
LAEQGKHPSVLVLPSEEGSEGEEEIPQRRDYCPTCWDRLDSRNYVGFWLARRDPPKPRKVQNRKERNARLAAYFDYFYHEDRAAHAARLCFLAHLLIRYQVLRWLRTEPPEGPGRGERIICRNTITDEEVCVEMVQLADEELAAIKQEVDDLLAGVLSPTTSPLEDAGGSGSGPAAVPESPDAD